MRKGILSKEQIRTDVLCIGGGIAGLMAAIRARELGAKVIVAEKGNSLRSGNAATGIDHFRCYIPSVHGPNVELLVRALERSQQGGLRPRKLFRVWMEKSFDIVKLWEEWGIPVKYQGDYDFQGRPLPGDPDMELHIAGQDLKRTLTHQALQRGVKIMNRIMVFELLGNGDIVGALAISTREEKLIEFKTKSIVLATGPCTRLYLGPTPGWMFNLRMSPACTGDGRAMAYRVGAEMVNVELPVFRCGPKYFARAGKGTWGGVIRDPNGNPVGPFVTKPDAKVGDPVVDFFQGVFRDYALTAKGPLYMDCRGISEQDFEYMMYFLKHEGNTSLLSYLKEEGIDVRNNLIEFMTYGDLYVRGGIYFNENGETSVKGLYAAGDEFGGGGSAAAIFGWVAGENAARYSQSIALSTTWKANARVEEKHSQLEDIRTRDAGPTWKEVNIALQQIMNDHAGTIRSETMLVAGLTYLQRLRDKANAMMMAENQHELMRCLEVLNLLDVGEIVFVGAIERRETRGIHVRSDYPLPNPLMEKLLVVKSGDGKPITAWREV